MAIKPCPICGKYDALVVYQMSIVTEEYRVMDDGELDYIKRVDTDACGTDTASCNRCGQGFETEQKD
jgi:hypothetical protein